MYWCQFSQPITYAHGGDQLDKHYRSHENAVQESSSYLQSGIPVSQSFPANRGTIFIIVLRGGDIHDRVVEAQSNRHGVSDRARKSGYAYIQHVDRGPACTEKRAHSNFSIYMFCCSCVTCHGTGPEPVNWYMRTGACEQVYVNRKVFLDNVL